MSKEYFNKVHEAGSKAGLTNEQVDQLCNVTKIMASYVVKELITNTTNYYARKLYNIDVDKVADDKVPLALLNEKERQFHKVVSELKKVKVTPYIGKVQLEFNEIPYIYVIKLDTFDSGYEFLMELPSEKYVDGAIEYITKLFNFAHGYFDIIVKTHPTLITAIEKFHQDAQISKLLLDENNKTLFLDPSVPKRIGVELFYINKEGLRISFDDRSTLYQDESSVSPKRQ